VWILKGESREYYEIIINYYSKKTYLTCYKTLSLFGWLDLVWPGSSDANKVYLDWWPIQGIGLGLHVAKAVHQPYDLQVQKNLVFLSSPTASGATCAHQAKKGLECA
jgi:uncharacterized membrane protein